MTVIQAKKELNLKGSPKKAKFLQGFFKTGKGDYAEGDVFIGVTVPETRKVAKNYLHLSIQEITSLLHSKIHEERLLALIIWNEQFKKGDEKTKRNIYSAYLRNTAHINNWDLVDVSAHKIIGPSIENGSRQVLYTLAKSPSMWDRRIAIVSTAHFIKKGDFKDTLELARFYLSQEEDLMHKATGWMLREVGKKDVKVLKAFLSHFSNQMPRTMLRYAIEKFPEEERQAYLKRD